MEKELKVDLFTSVILTATLMFYVVVTLLKVPVVPTLGKYMFLLCATLILILVLQSKPIIKKEIALFLPFLLFSLLYLAGATDTSGIMNFVNLSAYLMIIYIVYSIEWTKIQIKSFSYLYYISLPILFVLIFALPNLLNMNVVGSYAFYLSFFPLLYLMGYTQNLKKSRILLIYGLLILIILGTDSRSILLSFFFGLITFLAWKFITSKKSFFYSYLFLILALNYFIVVVYPNMYKWASFYDLNNLSLNITGKPLLTGRNTIWSQLVDLITLKPWIGYGSSVVPEDFLSTSLSAHNLYLQIGLQTGLIGIALLLTFFLFIWKAFRLNHQDPKVKLAACFFISILIHQSFEVTLTQNQFGIGLLQWLIIAFGLNYAFKNRNSIKKEPK